VLPQLNRGMAEEAVGEREGSRSPRSGKSLASRSAVAGSARAPAGNACTLGVARTVLASSLIGRARRPYRVPAPAGRLVVVAEVQVYAWPTRRNPTAARASSVAAGSPSSRQLAGLPRCPAGCRAPRSVTMECVNSCLRRCIGLGLAVWPQGASVMTRRWPGAPVSARTTGLRRQAPPAAQGRSRLR
jgi:hypothetical protein